jgi:hypothetical protein
MPLAPWSDAAAAFAAALRAPEAAPPVERGAKRFAAHRNAFYAGLADALAARFPVVRRLVGEAFFAAAARAFVVAHPPRSPILVRYGDEFASFLDGFEPASPLPYLGDVARLEAARTRAYHAADATPITATIRFDAALRLTLAPSAELLAFATPALSIWEAHQGAGPVVGPAVWGPEEALVARPQLDVAVHRLAPGSVVFLSTLGHGAGAADALAMARMRAPEFDACACLELSRRAGVVVAVRHG